MTHDRTGYQEWLLVLHERLNKTNERPCPTSGGSEKILHFKGTNSRQKSYEIFHVCCIFYSGFMCQTTVIFGITKDGSLVLDTLAS